MLAAPLAAWGRALKGVNRNTGLAPHCDASWKFWVPDPATLVRYPNPVRVNGYLTHWLELRRLWYPRLHDMSPRPSEAVFRSKQWIDLLDVGPSQDHSNLEKGTETGTRRLTVIGRFTRALGTRDAGPASGTLDAQPAFNDEPLWHGTPLQTSNETHAQQITWEIAEIGFRMELRALDRHLVQDNVDVDALVAEVFCHRPLLPVELPTSLDSLAAPTIAGRGPALEALRKLLSRWPNAPKVVATTPLADTTDAVTVLEVERAMCQFYLQTFWDVAGRAATVPRQFPLSSSTHIVFPP